MAKAVPRLSHNPQSIDQNTWYYEESAGICVVREVIVEGKYVRTEQFVIPWPAIKKSLGRRFPATQLTKATT